LVPFPFAVDDHQTKNAQFLERAGAAWIIQQAELQKADILQILSDKTDRTLLTDMALKARSVGQPNASKRVASICLEIMK
jgi:UDP-N-acetylglucosamine--N-acetylmuramyl-(pentapeptide) pyrophosphoryl-undecaprenol N-acetylglucosamine transferase